jgi:hypothetical protein
MNDWQAALAQGVSGFLGDLAKAGKASLEPTQDAAPNGDPRVFGPAARAPESLLFDPYAWYSGNQDFHQRPLSLDWNTLRRMAAAPPISAIIKRRCEDAEEFCQPEENPYLPGFKLRMRNRKASPSRAALRMIEELERFVLQGGVVEDMRQVQTRDDFPAFVKKVVRDSLTYDQLCFEVVPSRLQRIGGGFRPARFVAAPAHTIRIANTSKDGHALSDDDFETPRWVQVYDETVVNEYRPAELCFAVRNPRSDLEFVGYGYSELEMLVTIVTAWLNAFEYNRRFFSQGAGIPGILNLKGQVVNEKIMRAFKRELQMLTTGASNAHRMPVTSAEGMEFVNLHSTNREMEYSAWMDLLTKLACALYSMDPAEIGFNFGNTGQQSSMGSANQVEKIAESRERGLKPLIRFLFSQLNRFVIWQIDPDFEIVAQGLRSNSEADDLDLDKKRAETYMTVDQIRARYDMPAMADGKGACILNPPWLQVSQAAAAAQTPETPPETPVDTSDLFGPPDVQQRPPQRVGTPSAAVVQQDSQPAALAASMTARQARRPRVSSFTL